MKYYALYEGDILVTKGDADTLANMLITDRSRIYMAARNKSLMFHRFTVEECEEPKQEPQPIPKPKRKTKHQEKLEYLVWHLIHKEGITTLKGNPGEYIKELSDLGIDVYCYHAPCGDKNDWILEMI